MSEPESDALPEWGLRAEEFTSLDTALAQARARGTVIYAAVRGWVYRVYPGGRTVRLVPR